MAKREDRVLADIQQRMGAPLDRNRVSVTPDAGNTRVPYGTGARLASPYDSLYSRLTPEEQTCRSPEMDHWVAQWLKAFPRNQQISAPATI